MSGRVSAARARRPRLLPECRGGRQALLVELTELMALLKNEPFKQMEAAVARAPRGDGASS